MNARLFARRLKRSATLPARNREDGWARDAFDTLYEEGTDSARFMAISMHPYVMGAAHRVKYLDKIIRYIKEHDGVMFMTGEEILDWYNNVTA
jgi:peptidoglycan/xylan/chitin deacetylase (PgdA/CDA1 family)